MGRRRLWISPELLVDFLKGPGELHRTYTVENAIPADAQVVAVRVAQERDDLIEVALESDAWDSEIFVPLKELEPPTVRVHYHKTAPVRFSRLVHAVSDVQAGGKGKVVLP